MYLAWKVTHELYIMASTWLALLEQDELQWKEYWIWSWAINHTYLFHIISTYPCINLQYRLSAISLYYMWIHHAAFISLHCKCIYDAAFISFVKGIYYVHSRFIHYPLSHQPSHCILCMFCTCVRVSFIRLGIELVHMFNQIFQHLVPV